MSNFTEILEIEAGETSVKNGNRIPTARDDTSDDPIRNLVIQGILVPVVTFCAKPIKV